MKKYLGESNFQHDQLSSVGVLLVNLGTPDEPTPVAVRRYLGEFLWDPRIVELPRWLWWMILNFGVLNIRPKKSAKAYQKVWMTDGSPLLVISKLQKQALALELKQRFNDKLVVAVAMRYGNPSIYEALTSLKAAGVRKLLVLPLYPQYSATTTASVFDAVVDVMKTWRWIPELRFINQYHDNPAYIKACANRIEQHWQADSQADMLVFSFHGLPKKNLEEGDPYYCHCHKTARLIAQALKLNESQWCLAFQSRFGRQEWLTPYTDQTLRELPAKGIKSVDIFCPGFSADCLETLEEMAMENREVFLSVGGEQYNYIAALNDMPEHIQMLGDLIVNHVQGWHELSADNELAEQECAETKRHALAKGAIN